MRTASVGLAARQSDPATGTAAYDTYAAVLGAGGQDFELFD